MMVKFSATLALFSRVPLISVDRGQVFISRRVLQSQMLDGAAPLGASWRALCSTTSGYMRHDIPRTT